METQITREELIALGLLSEDLQKAFLRVANGLLSNGIYPKEKLLVLFAEVIERPKKFAFSKNKVTNLGVAVKKAADEGQPVILSEWGLSLLAEDRAKQPVYELPSLPGQVSREFLLREEALPYAVFGANQIEQGALNQMNTAMRLPIAAAGALMPDAHQGYGLPIGGVLATDANTVIPYAVGVDIACRMCLSVFDLPASAIDTQTHWLKSLLGEHTFFGMGSESGKKFETTLFDRPEWTATKPIRQLMDKAYRQLGTSGTGNHFVEWGELEVLTPDESLPEGRYLALLSHSGSRGFGGGIANHYSKVAMEKTRLPKEAQHLAWLELDSQEGIEYWIAMNLAGDYASANHHEIHNKITKALGQQPLIRIENHHNFAWKETLADGREVIVHRKGATPAAEGDIGIIPGSMTQPGYVVRGKGLAASLRSASHGAGRQMSRTKAIQTIQPAEVRKALEEARVQLIGAGLDEAPMAYKNLEQVMAEQTALVEVLARFSPRIVRMADGKEKAED